MAEREARLNELVGKYAALIRATVSKVAGRRDDDLGDEILQRISEALCRRLGEGATIEHPPSYLYRCAVRETVRELSRAARIARESHEDDVQAADDPEGAQRAAQLARATEACLTSMSSERAAAVRAHIAGFDVNEIMAMYDWPYQKARNLVARGLAELRLSLGEQGYP